MDRRTGGCHCGAVTYSIAGSVREVIYCHCGQCRRQSGHFVAATAAAANNLTLKPGQEAFLEPEG